MPTRPLPPHASLESIKDDARRLLRDRAAGDPPALQRLREFLPRLRGASDKAISSAELKWNDALTAIAREHGFASWPRLKAHLDRAGAPVAAIPLEQRIEDRAFRTAVALMDAGDEAGLTAQLAAHPDVATQRVSFEGGNYFRNPSLLAFIAENPIRCGSMPPNALAIARIVLEAGGGDSTSLDETLALVSSGRVAREAGVQVSLIEFLSRHGANPDAALQPALTHAEMEAAYALLRCGAGLTLPAAAALGMAEEAAALLSEAGAADRHLALANAAQHGHAEIVRLLLDAGEDPSRYNPEGTHSHSTPLHQAVLAGHEAVAKLLVERGARRDLRDTLFRGTPADWAEHAGRDELAAWLRS